VIYRSGDFICYHDDGHQKLGRLRAILKNNDGDYQLRIQKILNYNDLPGNLKGSSRQCHSLAGEVWLQNEPFPIIMTSQILGKVTIMMTFQHQNIPEDSLWITEIIYKCNDHCTFVMQSIHINTHLITFPLVTHQHLCLFINCF